MNDDQYRRCLEKAIVHDFQLSEFVPSVLISLVRTSVTGDEVNWWHQSKAIRSKKNRVRKGRMLPKLTKHRASKSSTKPRQLIIVRSTRFIRPECVFSEIRGRLRDSLIRSRLVAQPGSCNRMIAMCSAIGACSVCITGLMGSHLTLSPKDFLSTILLSKFLMRRVKYMPDVST